MIWLRRACHSALLACVLLGSATPVLAQEGGASLVISNVGVVDVEAGRVLPERTVVIENGRIASVHAGLGDGAGRRLPAGADLIDGTGRFLIPGLWDMHVHLRHPLAPSVLMPQFIAAGVTGVRDMAGDCEEPSEGVTCIAQLREWNRRIESGELVGPRILAIASFPLNPPGDYEVTEEQVRGLVRTLAGRGVDLVKIYYRLTPDAFGWVADEADRLGLALGGHLPLRMTALEASNAGLRSLEHARDFLFDCFPGSAEFRATARSQNPPMDVMRAMVEEHDRARCEETFAAFARNDTWYVPTHVTRRMDAYADDPEFRADPRQKYIPAEAWEAWQRDADRMIALDPSPEGRRIMRAFYGEGLEITGRAHAAGVGIVLGTDAGDTYVFPGSGAHDELDELVKAGLSPADALAAATVRAAEFLGLDDEYGTIEDGKRADVVLLSSNPLEGISNIRAIEMVILGGKPLTRADLDRVLEGVERAVADTP